MNSLGLSRYALILGAAAALLAGCGGSQPPIGAPGAMPQTSRLDSVLPFSRYRSAGADQVQYVTGEFKGGGLAEFDYPKSDSVIRQRTLEHGPAAECTIGARFFWVFEEESQRIVEFAAGRNKPIKTITVPSAPGDCSVDPTTGNLEVSLSGRVVIFTNASGSGRAISDKLKYGTSSTYDSAGNLFVVGETKSSPTIPALVELPKGKAAFKTISLPGEITGEEPGSGKLRWDGTYLAWSYSNDPINKVYRLSVRGNNATLEGTVSLEGIKGIGICNSIWIWPEASVLFCNDGHYIDVYAYPAGGNRIAQLGPMKSIAVGVVSLQP